METSGKKRPRLRIFAYVGLAAVFVTALGYGTYWAMQPCTLTIHPGCGGTPDPLVVESSTINSATSLTLQIFHGGQNSISLSSYYVKDAVGHLYSSPGWTSPTIPPMSHVNVTFTIDGRDFTFQSKNTYEVSVHTSQNYIMSFTVAT